MITPRILFPAAAALSFGIAHAEPAPALWGPHIDIEAKPGNKRTLGEADLFLPLSQDARTLVFGNLRTRFDNKSSYEGNLGAGVRHMYDSGWNLGAYGYWDHRRSGNGNFFDQVTLGAEALGRDWDFRTNVYIPQGNRVRTLSTTITDGGPSTAALVGTVIQVTTPGSTTSTREERSLEGYDLEAGWRLPFFDPIDSRQLRVYIGNYRFHDGVTTVSGPRLRAELALTDLPQLWRGAELLLGAEAQHDSTRGSQNFLSLRLRIPLGKAEERPRQLTWQERRMAAPVVRDVDVVTHARTVSTTAAAQVETATATTGNQNITVLNSATTNTAAALNAALAAAGANTVILSGTFNTNAIISMAAGQTLIGGGSLTVQSASGRTATLSLPGATIAAMGNSAQRALQMANNATLSGLTVTNGFSAGIEYAVGAQNLTGVTIRNSTIVATGSTGTYAMDMRGTNNAVVTGNTITATPSAGGAIGIQADSAANITIANNVITTAVTPSIAKYVVTSNIWTSFAAGSTGNVAVGGTCLVTVGAPTGSVGFSTITCP